MSLSSSAMPSSTIIKPRQASCTPISLNDLVPMGAQVAKSSMLAVQAYSRWGGGA